MQTGYPHGYVNVHTSSSTTYQGSKPYVGESVDVSATGSWSSLTAVAVSQKGYAPQSTSVPTHIPTWAMDEYWGSGANGSAAQVRQYLTYAEGGLGNSKAQSDCSGSGSCHSVFYFNPHILYNTSACGSLSADTASFLKQASESWYVHLRGYSDSSHRLYGSYTESCGGKTVTIPVYEINDANAATRAFYTSYIHTNAGTWDYFFMDNTHGGLTNQMYGPGGGMCHNASGGLCASTQELPTDASVVAEHQALANALSHSDGSAMQGFFNALDVSGGQPTSLNVLQSSSHFIGTVCESCVVSLGTFRPTMYATVLNSMAKTNAIPNAQFVELNQGTSPAGSSAQIAQRTITTAMAWLGYSPGHTVVYPNLEANTNNLAVFPENSIVPMSPLQTMSSGATNLEVASGVYRREFSSCYNAGTPIGPCAAIVNATGGNVVVSSSWLHQTYGHVVELIGGDIPSGGHISLTSAAFHANSTYIAPAQGIMIVR